MDLQPVCEDDTVTVSSDSRLFFLPPQVLLQIVPFVQCYSTAGRCVQWSWPNTWTTHIPPLNTSQVSHGTCSFLHLSIPVLSTLWSTPAVCLLVSITLNPLLWSACFPSACRAHPMELTMCCLQLTCLFPGCECDAALHSFCSLAYTLCGSFPQAHPVQTRCR